jgi:hypothetical protein
LHAARRACLSGNVLFALTPQVPKEYVNVATDPRGFKLPLTMDQALEKFRLGRNSSENQPPSDQGKKPTSSNSQIFHN